ncbi:MAG: efflux RND transporter periplasmic adaptor subunit [Nitrospiraceae bacterium]|nr:efflux RND transporter periplasmic adaptor subunit [Nitrospiraceae bacterium]MDA8088794.1 efflux RND transporter periplasmic adaptor subunit [Nitrospiraceae bacterium]
MKKKIIAIVVAIVLIAGAAVAIKKKKEAIARTPVAAVYPLPVDAATAKKGSLDISSEYIGTIEPLNYADISPRITGNILSVNVREGDIVHKGQLLVTIDDRQLAEKESAQALEIPEAKSQLSGAKSVYETQQAIYERDEMLYKAGAISLESLQRSKAQRDSAYAEVKSLQDKIKALKNIYRAAAVETSYARLRSPIDGIVAKRLEEPGDLAVPGKPVLKVECTSGFKVVVQIPQTEMPLMKKGGRVILYDGNTRLERSAATISRVYPAVDVGTLGTIEIDVPSRPFDVPSGGTVNVDVITGRIARDVIIPLNALLEDRSGSFVYRIDGGKIRVLRVHVAGKNGEYAALDGSLKNGDMVATGDEGKLLRLSDGMAVVARGQAAGR